MSVSFPSLIDSEGLELPVRFVVHGGRILSTRRPVVSRKTTQLQLIQAGFGVALLPACMRDIAPASVRFIPLQEACPSTVALACRRDAGNWCASSSRQCPAQAPAQTTRRDVLYDAGHDQRPLRTTRPGPRGPHRQPAQRPRACCSRMCSAVSGWKARYPTSPARPPGTCTSPSRTAAPGALRTVSAECSTRTPGPARWPGSQGARQGIAVRGAW